jgi:ABC-2 type transport system ATP-binding protein
MGPCARSPGVSLEIERGEFFALLGPNGAGKTTLISALGGLAIPDAGTLSVMGHDVRRDYRDARRSLGIVPQEIVFDPFFTVRETLEIQSGYFGLRRNGAWIDELLEKLALTGKARANMRSLSGGMKRRVMVAQALVHRPPVIVLDEPTAGWTSSCAKRCGASSAASTRPATRSSSPRTTSRKRSSFARASR